MATSSTVAAAASGNRTAAAASGERHAARGREAAGCAPRAGGSRHRGRARPGGFRRVRGASRTASGRRARWLTRVDRQPERSHPAGQGPRREVNEVAWKVEMEPAVAEHARLEAGAVRDRARTARPAARAAARRGRSTRPGHGRCSSECQKTIAAKSPLDLREIRLPDVLAPRIPLEPDRLAPQQMKRIEKRTVTGAHVQHRPGRRHAIDARGEARAGTAQHGVAEPREAAVLGPVVRVRVLELRGAGPGIGRRSSAPRAVAAATPGFCVGAREGRPAPHAASQFACLRRAARRRPGRGSRGRAGVAGRGHSAAL